MLRKLFSVVLLVSAASVFAAPVFPVAFGGVSAGQCTPNPRVVTDATADFCTVFPKSVASCSPIKPGAAGPTKQYMLTLAGLIKVRYGTIANGCKYTAAQNGSTIAACVSQWNCYLNGGKSSDPQEPGMCSGTGVAC